MKLKTLAIAIAAAAMPFAAQAELKIGGDITVGYFGDAGGNNSIDENGSEVNLDASEKIGGVTYYGHAEVDFQGGGNAANFEEVRVGAKGGFGEVIFGETDNGCDLTDVGGDNSVWMTHGLGGCRAGDRNNLAYKRSMGPATVAVSYSPEESLDNFSVGVKGKMGPVTASLGYEDGDGVPGGSNVVVGMTTGFGPVTLALRASEADGEDTRIGAHFLYTAGSNSIYGGMGNDNAGAGRGESWALGYKKTIGKTDFIVEAADFETYDHDNDATTAQIDSDTQYGIGMRHNF